MTAERTAFPVARVEDVGCGTVSVVPRIHRVAIVGTGPSRAGAPFGDPSWECWGLNEIPQPRATRWFELHPMAVQSPRDLAFLAATREPVYVLEPTPLVPAGVRYPLDRIRAAGLRSYFTCTFAYQLALALLEGFEEVGLWGVELWLGTARERTAERACVEYWLGVAEGRGVRVAADSGLARAPYLYGYDYDAELRDVARDVARLRDVVDLEASTVIR